MKNYKDMSTLVTSQINNELSRNTQSNTPCVSIIQIPSHSNPKAVKVVIVMVIDALFKVVIVKVNN